MKKSDSRFEGGCEQNRDSPLPSAGEGFGGEGEGVTESSSQDKTNTSSLTSRARELRHSDTLAEKLAWNLLRNRHLLHHKFRRQLPLGNAIVDFCCLSLKLVVELDGAVHPLVGAGSLEQVPSVKHPDAK